MAKKKMGRPKIPVITPDLDEDGLASKLTPRPINMTEVFYWMDLGATAEEIAGAFHCGVKTLARRLDETYGMTFGQLKEKICGRAKIELRKNQFQLSKTNASMGIWLGKQWLGQKDNIEDIKDLLVHELRAGIKQISQESRGETLEQSILAAQQSLSDR